MECLPCIVFSWGPWSWGFTSRVDKSLDKSFDDPPDVVSAEYDGISADALADMIDVPRVVIYESVGSTLDAAHALAANGAPSGTVVFANTQTAGRGRSGQRWSSPSGNGIWLTLIERVTDRSALDVLSLRVGLGAAYALDAFAPEPIRLKWPNDLYIDRRKLAGILVETRWRAESAEWVAIGLGVNVIPPDDQPNAIGLDAGTRRMDVLPPLVRELRDAAARTGPLDTDELEEFNARDMARGKECIEPLRGRVRGITPDGELLVELADATVKVRSGSLVLA
jgi:BirA family biotin operon repressor/biotin-[acetyl-CoA-carboxylase] ligase